MFPIAKHLGLFQTVIITRCYSEHPCIRLTHLNCCFSVSKWLITVISYSSRYTFIFL